MSAMDIGRFVIAVKMTPQKCSLNNIDLSQHVYKTFFFVINGGTRVVVNRASWHLPYDKLSWSY